VYDQSVNHVSIARVLRTSDFNDNKALKAKAVRDAAIEGAVASGHMAHWETTPLKASILRGKNVYSLPSFSNELLIRKVNNNVRHFVKIRHPARTSIVTNLTRIVSEAVQYRIYKLDVKSFYESFAVADVLKKIDDIEQLSLATKKIIREIFKHVIAMDGSGIPRGLALSATLSDFMMQDFDRNLRNKNNVFFYSRYVDDIIIVTSGSELEQKFIKSVEDLLPNGLKLSRKKRYVKFVPHVTDKSKTKYDFEYLGYKFSVCDPGAKDTFRSVILDIADSKIKKIKTRVTLAVAQYKSAADFQILEQRIKFLTGNFSIPDDDRVKKKLAGIFYNYHLMDSDQADNGLNKLDRFLRTAILSSSGTIFSKFQLYSSVAERKILLGNSFEDGFNTRSFMHFSPASLNLVQGCWKYA